MASFETLRHDYNNHLEKCFKLSDLSGFQKKCLEMNTNVSNRKSIVDQALRDTLLTVLLDDSVGNVQHLESYITFCIELCRKDLTTASMPVILLGDIFDCMTLDRCEKLFTFVENNVVVWKEEIFFSACKNNLLRMCNDLLRRLSRSQQTVFCGRILLFLAKFFPFSERSGLNIVSEFNLDNHTEFGNEKSEQEVLEQIVEDGDNTENKIPIDYNLYRKFWALQDFFRNPNQCYNKMHWKVFSAHTSHVLSAFTSFKLEEQRSLPTKCTKMDTSSEENYKETHYFAKYLTNQKLLELQLSDSNFRRYVLLQFLILFQYLNSAVKFKAETHELKPDQVEWVKTTTDQVYLLLSETPPNGSDFAETVKNILKREEHWNAWKNHGCPPFKRPALESNSEGEEPRKQKRRIGDVIRAAEDEKKYHLGNPELTKLWNLCPNNLEACKSMDRDFLPSLETYFAEAIEQLDPAAMVDDEYKKVNDGNFGWRALRLLARRSPHFFVHGNNPINKLPEYLEAMIKKIAKDRPQTQSDIKTESEEIPTDGNEAEFNEDVLKQETEQVEVDASTTKFSKFNKVTADIVAKLSDILKGNWKDLAAKFGYHANEIAFFQKKRTQYEQCKSMLEIWAEEDEDASIENLAYILEGLGFTEAVAVLKS
ncbi:THO complex subunit 1 isoform X1 [Neodiprion pinetum]|uniref:THO complex subunit 1 isoform X1 n=2 Tax=Neodiprion lecontei TaxID=441921 RepID=A0A6J0BT61_NEOLC|nr:THO complex subunit 1 isoform X1 [Neodiprion lecontei]XP_046466311.1 THO complex subunit 1 isoform X1 [Neodiprion pinetum]XP_046466312.1 THO complex subunit 1 isoform X1 [Neodiprion pinetum]